MRFNFILLLFCLTTSGIVVNAAQNYQKILLTDVQSLILKKHMMTSSRRTSPVPQLKCMSNCGYADEIETVFCKNVGTQGMDVNWECTAKPQLPAGLKLGDLEVVCEGYKTADDPYILVGSCGLEYTLIGEPEYGSNNYRSHGSNHYSSSRPYRSTSSSSDGWPWFSWVIFALVIYFIYRSCTSRNQPGYGMGGGGGGGGGVNGPPPPPSYSQAQHQPGYGESPGNPSYSGYAANQGQPGFWSGIGAGGIMGYMLGSRPSYGYGYNNYMHPPASSFFNSGYGSGYGSGFGSGFGSGSSFSSSSSSRSSPADSTSYATSRRR